jgi:hypothetical protein
MTLLAALEMPRYPEAICMIVKSVDVTGSEQTVLFFG